ncbi:hypothetical protein [Nodularia chucula]|uniref:hypothetical protein n=1 Tax=Nodularia chucula TaxID=3093667 RepID=UPI0039C5AED0
MTATITRPKPKKSTAASKQKSPYKRLHVIIPIEDMLWASQQKPSVNQLWQECWTADPYGSRWMPLSTAMGYSSFIAAKKVLSDSGVFIFKPDKSIQDGRETVGWLVRNLHGSRMKEFWEGIDSTSQKPNAEKTEPNSQNSEMNAGFLEIDATNLACISSQPQSEQAFCKTSRTPRKHLTNSSKEIVRCDSSTQHENSHCEETAIAPLGGASPQIVEGVEEKKEELPTPTVTDCTSLALVDAVQGESAFLEGENQSCCVKPTVFYVRAASRREGTYSAAPVAQNEQTTLIGENKVSGDEDKTHHYHTLSAAPDHNDEKWSSEGIATRLKARPKRMEKLKMAGILGEKPDFEFLHECWNDDPALQIVIKKLLAKFPPWGIACVDGVLVNREK